MKFGEVILTVGIVFFIIIFTLAASSAMNQEQKDTEFITCINQYIDDHGNDKSDETFNAALKACRYVYEGAP